MIDLGSTQTPIAFFFQLNQVLDWLHVHASAVQAATGIISTVAALIVGSFALYSARAFWLQRDQASAERMRFTVRILTLYNGVHELAEDLKKRMERPSTLAAVADFMNEWNDNHRRELRELIRTAPALPPRAFFLLEAANRKMGGLRHGFKAEVLADPTLRAATLKDIERVVAALAETYEAMPLRNRRDGIWGEDLVEMRSRVHWLIERGTYSQIAADRKHPLWRRMLRQFPPPLNAQEASKDKPPLDSK